MKTTATLCAALIVMAALDAARTLDSFDLLPSRVSPALRGKLVIDLGLALLAASVSLSGLWCWTRRPRPV